MTANMRVLVIAPVGQDGVAIASLLAERGLEAQVCGGPAECCVEITSGVGALVLTEEVLEMEGALTLLNALNTQPAWSELPLIILTTGGEYRLAQLLDLAATAAGVVTLLERPIGMLTLLRSVEVALDSRRRQYQVRDLLERQRRDELELREAHEKLADRARELETQVRLRTARLEEANEQLRSEMAKREKAEGAREALRRQLLNAQEEERRRIARELHDQMGQNLTALHLGLKSLRDGDSNSASLPSRVQPLQELAMQTARDLHRVALELRPAALDDLGLVKAIEAFIRSWSDRYEIEVDFATDGYRSAGVSPETKIALYRIIQEALNNVAKHSGARRVSIVLSRTDGQVQAIIEDDGCGFDAAAARKSSDGRKRLGLLGIEERLVIIDGSLQVESSAKRGATLIVRVPISKAA